MIKKIKHVILLKWNGGYRFFFTVQELDFALARMNLEDYSIEVITLEDKKKKW